VTSRAVFLDTSFVIALENRRDPLHSIAKQLDRGLQEAGAEYLLHRGVVLEVGDGDARRARRTKGVDFVRRFHEEDGYRVEPIDDDLWRKAVDLYCSRPDKEWGLTDCVSFALMEREGIREALTTDPHFRQAGFVPLLLEPETSA
jgi:uncharacterized protein